MREYGDLIKANDGNIYSYTYNYYIGKPMWRAHGKNKVYKWKFEHNINIEENLGNIYDIVDFTSKKCL